jgi:hypothetical protein
MNDDQAFERATRELMEDGSDRTSAATIDAVLLAVRTTPQERDLRIPWRTVPMSNPMRLVAAIAVIVVVGVALLIGINLGTGSSNVGGPAGSSPSPAPTPSAPAPIPSPTPSPTMGIAKWTIYTSNRYGFSIGYPSDWALRPAVSTWALPVGNGSAGAGGLDDPMGTSTEGFIELPAQSILVSAWSVAVAPGTSAAAWIQTYCPKATTPCTGIPARTVAVSMDGHAGSLVTFGDDDEAFVLVNNRMYIVAEWVTDKDPATLPYGSGTQLVEDFLSTQHLLPGGPGASASPQPS